MKCPCLFKRISSYLNQSDPVKRSLVGITDPEALLRIIVAAALTALPKRIPLGFVERVRMSHFLEALLGNAGRSWVPRQSNTGGPKRSHITEKTFNGQETCISKRRLSRFLPH